MVRLAVVLVIAVILAFRAAPAGAEGPLPNVRPTQLPPDVGRPSAASTLARLPSTSTAGYGRSDSSATEAAFTALTRTVTVVPGWVELGGVRPVAVRAYVSAGHVGPR